MLMGLGGKEAIVDTLDLYHNQGVDPRAIAVRASVSFGEGLSGSLSKFPLCS
ncbi:hypothetical protein H6G97_36235 [Nostoc flagelliforme FACHB-838]|uniref:Uncharacterized protein n=1 Tax=Nostoc flagelliforme FACHB-838 TaxID=2692904 RepID=A0ABR8E097_9NOSO|nr:hypothetical protein [Nostoc flagelliforme FACHB-838]